MKIMVMLAIWITLLTGCIDPNAKQRIQWEEDRREKLAEDERKSRKFWIKQKAFEEDLHRQMKELAMWATIGVGWLIWKLAMFIWLMVS